MKAFFLFAILIVILSSCKQDTICSCIETGKKLDGAAQEILTKGTSPGREEKLKALKAEKQQKCAEFERMDGATMLKRMKDCD